ncbi:UDP-glucose 4-epimerase GalE [Candidatus Margulisiibacteriota bacterium]
MILVVGGAGYIGSHTNKVLNKLGYETVVYDNLSAGYEEFVQWGKLFVGDIGNVNELRTCFEKYPISAVMNFSGYINVGESCQKPDRYYRNNVVNTLTLLNTMREFNITKFIFSSTAAIFGDPQEIPITEEHPKNPINPYGNTKLTMERVLADYDKAYGFKHINLRYFNAAGADPESRIGERHEPESHLIPLTILAALGKREDIKIFGTDYPTKDGTCIRDYIHVDDLAMAHVKALAYLNEKNQSESFNLGNNQGFSVREIIETVKRISGRDFKVIEAERRSGDPAVLISSDKKVKQVLGWRQEFNEIDFIVKTAWEWHKVSH